MKIDRKKLNLGKLETYIDISGPRDDKTHSQMSNNSNGVKNKNNNTADPNIKFEILTKCEPKQLPGTAKK